MNQQAIVFGSQEHLAGIVTMPNQDDCRSALILVTAGMLTSSGPMRLHVQLADQLAERGIASLRFDLSGIGESLGIGGGLRSIDRAAGEISAAIDVLLDTSGCESVTLFGLCSGADDSVQAALADPRVDRIILMDGCGYRTPRFYRHRLIDHYLCRSMQSVVWKRRLAGLVRPDEARASSMPLGFDVREFPDRDTATAQFNTLVRRGVLLHFIYTGGVAGYYNHAEQFWNMLPDVDWNGQASTTFFADMDHVAMLTDDRDRLIDDILQRASPTL